MKTITASERTTLIRLASTLPVGDETRKALINGLAQTREAGRGWGCEDTPPPAPGEKCKSKSTSETQKKYEKPPAPKKRPCKPEGDGPCYRKHNDYGTANSGTNGSPQRKEYNKTYRKNHMG